MSFDRAALRLGAAGQVGTRRGARIAHGGYARRRPCLRCNSASSSCGVRIAVTGTHSNDSRCADHDSKQAGEDCDAQLAAQPRRSAEVTELGMKIRIENHGLLPRHRRSNATALKPFPQACRPSPPADRWQITTQIFNVFHNSVDHWVAGAIAKRRHSPGTPVKACMPRFSNAMPEPTTKSFTVLETRTSPGIARPAIRLPICTAIPPTFLLTIWHSPVWSPALTSIPIERTRH